ncbi:MAG: hypothetical protein K6E53_06535 [Lachnospiraceae bacterium]|jgi:hypothetical protein|nr:hypothetical protein [Lachnospiraceae bacterium]
MATLLVVKEQLAGFYSRFEAYLNAVLKFLLTLVALLIINADLGYMSKIDNGAIVLIVSLLCSFLPVNLIVIILAIFVLLHVYALSLTCAAIVGILFVIMFVLYLRFAPSDAAAVILTPICYIIKIPYVVPLTLGFVGNPMSCVSVACGTAVYFMLNYVKNNADQIASFGNDAESALGSFKYIIDGLLGSDQMLLMIITFAVVVISVFMIKSLPVDYSWKIALGMGVVVNVLIILIGCSALEVDMSIGGVLVGTIVSALIVLVIQFFIFNVDYSRTENVQFEDDEYYYYVKAIPKISMEAPDVNVTRFNPRDEYDEYGEENEYDDYGNDGYN